MARCKKGCVPAVHYGEECQECGAGDLPPGFLRSAVWDGDLLESFDMTELLELKANGDILPEVIIGRLEKVLIDGPDMWVSMEAGENFEFVVPEELLRECRAYPGDIIRVTWSGVDLSDEVIRVERLN